MNTGHIHRQEDHATGSDGLHLFVNCLSFALRPAPAGIFGFGEQLAGV
jgi:hypothetical protein